MTKVTFRFDPNGEHCLMTVRLFWTVWIVTLLCGIGVGLAFGYSFFHH